MMKNLYEILGKQFKVVHFNNSTDLVTKIGELIESGDLVMVKGSNGMKMSAICSAIKNLLD